MPPLNIALDDLVQQIDADLPDADPVTKVGEARKQARVLGDLGDRLIDHYVQQARAAGASWSQIGDAMGVTKQAAQQRMVPGKLKFDRFTDRARNLVTGAQRHAVELRHRAIGTEHVLLALIDEREGLATTVLRLLGGDLDRLAETTRAGLTPGDAAQPYTGHTPFDAQVKNVLEETRNTALDLGHNYVGTEHILLGLLRVPDSKAAELLTAQGVDYTRAKDAVVAVLAGYQHRGKKTP